MTELSLTDRLVNNLKTMFLHSDWTVSSTKELVAMAWSAIFYHGNAKSMLTIISFAKPFRKISLNL